MINGNVKRKYKTKKRKKQRKLKPKVQYKYKYKYNVLIFKNMKIYKYLKTYKSLELATKYIEKEYDKIKDIGFEIKTLNNRKVEYEIALIERNSRKNIKIYKSDDLGRNIPVVLKDDEYKMLKLLPYKIEEKIQHYDSHKRFTINEFINTFLSTKTFKMVSKLNNKIVIQDDDKLDLFILKNINDADRFMQFLEEKIPNKNKTYMLVRDVSTSQRKYLYEELEKKGYSRKLLYSHVITRTRGVKTHSQKSQS